MKHFWVACLNEQQRFALASPRLESYQAAEAFAAHLDLDRIPVIIIQ